MSRLTILSAKYRRKNAAHVGVAGGRREGAEEKVGQDEEGKAGEKENMSEKEDEEKTKK
jgi:hypothetical protein